MKLSTFFHSCAARRTRIVLNLTGIAADEPEVIHLARAGGEQHAEANRARNPAFRVPLLDIGNGHSPAQSRAIIN